MEKFSFSEFKDTRSGFGDALLELGKKDKNVVALCADLTGSLKMNGFAAEFPDRFFQVGIADKEFLDVVHSRDLDVDQQGRTMRLRLAKRNAKSTDNFVRSHRQQLIGDCLQFISRNSSGLAFVPFGMKMFDCKTHVAAQGDHSGRLVESDGFTEASHCLTDLILHQ